MKAISQDRYGPPEVLRLTDLDQPEPSQNQVLVQVHAAGINPADIMVMTGVPYVMRLGFGPRRPRVRVRGFDVAGTVASVGPGVTGFQPGDEVYGEGDGTLAEFTLARPDRLARKPASLTSAQAAAVPMAGLTALHAIRDHGRVGSGAQVLIIGAAGGIGTFAVQIARSLGAVVRLVVSSPNPDDLAALTELLESGTIRPVIDKTYPLAQAADAVRHVATGHARGKVVVTVPLAPSPPAG
ncbi:MAG: NAD(P)-dependent alcohol dehydrogenase [Natronosporangium sp.]